MSTGEFDLIDHAFRKKAPFIHRATQLANGDDASVHAIPAGFELVLSTDMSVADTHWPLDFPLKDAACRAVNAALSDLAAMGAEACWVWCCAALTDVAAGEEMGDGVAMALKNRAIELAGGDTVHAPINSLSVTVSGIVPEGSAMRRDAACAGDGVWLCGNAGLAAFALQRWQQGSRSGQEISAFQQVKPLLNEGIVLRKAGVRCCIDVSDGLLADAGHLADASSVAIEIETEKVPGFDALCRFLPRDEAAQLALTGGEDYALLFTAAMNLGDELKPWATCIGRCTAGAGVRTTLEGRPIELKQQGYEHFA